MCLTKERLCPKWHGWVPVSAGSGILHTLFLLFFFHAERGLKELFSGSVLHRRSVSLERKGMENGRKFQSPQTAQWGHNLEVKSHNAKGNI